MPRQSEWTEQLPAALEELRRFPAPVIDRAILEKVLRIHRRAAIRLMHRVGGFQVGKTFLIDRLQLIGQLEQIGRGEEVTAERDRRARLADVLEKTRRLAPGRKIRIDTAADVRDRVLKDLPAGIHLQPGELRIEFFGAEDLLRHLFELSQAMVNDYARFQAVVEDSRLKRGDNGGATAV
jgi:hypothetical protein